MDNARFDALTRRLSSRRTALSSLLGGVAAVLGLAGPKAVSSHNPLPACKRIKDPRKRLACLRRARRHNRNKHSCKPQPKAVTCANRCGRTRNNCKKPVNCTCPTGKTCLANFGCSRTCTIAGMPGNCPAGCNCLVALREAPTTLHCYPSTITDCPHVPLPCATSANCPRGFFCGQAVCDDSGLGRCFPNCPV